MTRVYDIEADGFYDDVTKCHCIVSIDPDTMETTISPHDFGLGLGHVISHDEHLQLLSSTKQVGHNILAYDIPVLEKLFGYGQPELDMVDDTFIMSSLFSPDIAIPRGCSSGAHRLGAWGIRMNYPQGDVDSFDEYTEDMLKYCIRDTEITVKLYRKMQAIRKKHDWELSLKIEKTMARLQNAQERVGVVLDEPKCYDLVEELMEEISSIGDKILPQVPAKPKRRGADVKPFVASGDYSANTLKWYGDLL